MRNLWLLIHKLPLILKKPKLDPNLNVLLLLLKEAFFSCSIRTMWIVPVLGMKTFPTEKEAFAELNRIWNQVIVTIRHDFETKEEDDQTYIEEHMDKVVFPESEDGRVANRLYKLWLDGFDDSAWTSDCPEEKAELFERTFLSGTNEKWFNNDDNGNFFVWSWKTYRQQSGDFPTYPVMVPVEVSD